LCSTKQASKFPERIATFDVMSENRKFLLSKQVREMLESESCRALEYRWGKGFDATTPENSGYVALGLARVDMARAWSWFEQLLEALEAHPTAEQGARSFHTGGLLWLLSKRDADKQRAQDALHRLLPRITRLHSHWYRHGDPEEEGLLSCDGMQSPLPNSLLIWSNECLIDMGRRLKLDVTEWVEQNELAIYSMNEKLWSEARGLYDAFNLRTRQRIPCETAEGLVPLLGPIPSQEQAERMAQTLCSPGFWGTEENPLYSVPGLRADAAGFEADTIGRGAVSMPLNWLIWRGLQRYEFNALARQVRLDTLELIERYGFCEHFDARRTALGMAGNECAPSAVTAGLCMDLLANKA
jgi:hypothetical protein